MLDVAIGKTNKDTSSARIAVTADEAVLDDLLDDLRVHGANRVDHEAAVLVAADPDGVFPAGFHSTTNLDTEVLVDGEWRRVEQPRDGLRPRGARRTARSAPIPMHRVRAGDRIVVGRDGVRVQAPGPATTAPARSSS